MIHIPKKYGESKIDKCPFCGSQAIITNSQKIAVCLKHKNSILDDLKCACGSYLETKVGKFGVYFNCVKCGNVNLRRALEINPPKESPLQNTFHSQEKTTKPTQQEYRQKPKETIVRSDDPMYFD